MPWTEPMPPMESWGACLRDPLRPVLIGLAPREMGERLMSLAPAPQGPPAFDPDLLKRLAAELPVDTGSLPHPLLARSVRVGLAHIELTFRGDQPRYGTGVYAQSEHEGFPPTIVATVDALTLWGLGTRARRLFGHWLHTFVARDGHIRYYGPSVSEYGQLLTTARRLVERGAPASWLVLHRAPLQALALYLRDLVTGRFGVVLPVGVPEADEAHRPATYFHNAAWAVRGMRDWSALLAEGLREPALAAAFSRTANLLRSRILAAIADTWPADPTDWWLSPVLEADRPDFGRPPRCVTGTTFGSYTNYRYWPELLGSGVLPADLARRVVRARLSSGGQLAGATRFEAHLDNWPLMDHLEGLWALGLRQDYWLCLWGHVCVHQAAGHLTAYEQVSLPPGGRVADHCLPCQLVAARATPRLLP